MKKRKSRKSAIIISVLLILILCGGAVVFFLSRRNSAKKIIDMPTISEIIPWSGADPYPSVDWSHATPGLHDAVLQFEEKWGSKLHVLQVYRPAEYTRHIRSVWEVWRYVHGKSYTSGYGCTDYAHINPTNIKNISSTQRVKLESEARTHGFTNGGDTPPACVSDHSRGFAVDIDPPSLEPALYKEWIRIGNEAGLCHYIQGDEPHFGLPSHLPLYTNCTAE